MNEALIERYVVLRVELDDAMEWDCYADEERRAVPVREALQPVLAALSWEEHREGDRRIGEGGLTRFARAVYGSGEETPRGEEP